MAPCDAEFEEKDMESPRDSSVQSQDILTIASSSSAVRASNCRKSTNDDTSNGGHDDAQNITRQKDDKGLLHNDDGNTKVSGPHSPVCTDDMGGIDNMLVSHDSGEKKHGRRMKDEAADDDGDENKAMKENNNVGWWWETQPPSMACS